MMASRKRYYLCQPGRFNRQLLGAVESLRDFLADFPPGEVQKCSWELLHAGFASNNADRWSAEQRSEHLFFYHHLNRLAPMLILLEKQLAAVLARRAIVVFEAKDRIVKT